MIAATRNSWREDDRKKNTAATIASVIVHILLILLVAVVFALRPTPVPPPEEEAPVELTLIAPPPPPIADKPAYVATSESQVSPKAPENPVFESDKDTLAASTQPAAGDVPLPTQEGRENPALEFEDREYTPGKEARPATPAAAPPPQQTAPPEPQPEPAATPRLTTQLALLEPPKPKTETPKPPVEKPKETQDQPVQKPIESRESKVENPSPPTPPGYQPQTRVTRIRGNISNRGRSAVNAAATPLGRYKKMLSDAIGSRWYYYVNEQMGLLTMGTVELKFIVTPDGRARKVQVVRNSSNESFANCSVRAVVEAEIPPIPEDLVPLLENGRIEIEYSFTILSN